MPRVGRHRRAAIAGPSVAALRLLALASLGVGALACSKALDLDRYGFAANPGPDAGGSGAAGSNAAVGDGMPSTLSADDGPGGAEDMAADGMQGDDTPASAPADPGVPTPCEASANAPCPCVEGTTLACGPGTDEGICALGTRACVGGAWQECIGAIFPAVRNCASSADNDCDGVPDDTIDGVCACVPNAIEPCDEHPGLDGTGICRAGRRTCIAAAGSVSSSWGACTGAVAPLPRNCTSTDDNDCDGLPDNTIDGVCQCQLGQTLSCEAIISELGPDDPLPGGCAGGTAPCVLAGDRSASFWGECLCTEDEYCNTNGNACDSGASFGVCSLRPEVCSFVLNPVCGCDGATYSNSCVAAANGVSVASVPGCDAGGGEAAAFAGARTDPPAAE